MRAWEFIDTVPINASVSLLGNERERPITLRYLNKLKNRKRRREAEFAIRRPLIAAMYGDADEQAALIKDELEREADRHEIEMLKQEVELLKDQIAVDIDAAEIDAEQKERISQGAMRAIARKKKDTRG